MSCPHCDKTGPSSNVRGLPGKARQFRHRAGRLSAVLPGILLVLMPKCPICLAAYIALFTGISIPIAAATWLRWSLIILCVIALVWLIVRWSLYLYRHSIH